MLQGMDRSEFGQFVAALWERQGWQTQIKRDGEKVFVAVQNPRTGEEGLLWTIPTSEGEVGGKQVQQFAKLGQQYEVEESAIVTAGSVSEHARKAASSTGIELLDGDGITAFVRRRDLGDLVRKFGGETEAGGDGGGGRNGTAGGSDGESGSSPLAPILGVLETVGARASGLLGGSSPVSGKAVVAVVVVLALAATGVLYGPSLPFVGGDGESGAISGGPAPNGSATLHVGWNAKVVDTIDPNESDDRAFYAPEGERFVLVRLNVTNVGESEVPVKQTGFKLRTENATYGYQPLGGYDGFMDHPMPPGRNYKGWTVFTVPEGTTGTLVYRANATVGVEFERESDLPVTVKVR